MTRKITALFLSAALTVGPAAAQEGAFDLVFEGISSAGGYLAGRQAAVNNDPGTAAGYFLDALEYDWTNPFLVENAMMSLTAAGNIESAGALASRILEIESDNDLARIILGTKALKERRYSSAITDLSEVTTETLTGITASVIRAWALVASDRYAEAAQIVEAVDQRGFVEFLRLHRGLMADVAGQTEEAITLLGEAYEADPRQFRVVEAYARALANAGRFDEAQGVINEYGASGALHPVVLEVANAVAANKRPGKFATNAQSGAAELLFGLGLALSGGPASDLSLYFLAQARYLNPASSIYAISIGEAYDRAGQYALANAIYESIPPGATLRNLASIHLAQNLLALEKNDEALDHLEAAVAEFPDDLDIADAYADMLRIDNRYLDAAEAYGRVIELSGPDRPGTWRYYYTRGIAYERGKAWEMAEPDFLKALELAPEQPQVLNYLGYSWVDQGINLTEGLELIRRAVEMQPRDGYIVDSLGWAYYRLGRYQDAVDELERAVNLKPGDPTINDHLGDAYWSVGREREARYQWNIARDLGPKEDGALETILEKLENGLADDMSQDG